MRLTPRRTALATALALLVNGQASSATNCMPTTTPT